MWKTSWRRYSWRSRLEPRPGPADAVLASFTGLPHRLEWVTTRAGVDFYDDSKGTNVGAVARSLTSFDRPVILIAGGRDKDSDFSLLNGLIARRVKALVLLGETKERLARVWEGLAPVYLAADMPQAVARARPWRTPGRWCCSRPPVPASTCSGTTPTGVKSFRKR